MKKILLVNAVAASLERDKGALNRADFQILAAASAGEALRIHRDEKVNLIIAELDMPDLGGDLLCSLVRKESGIRNVSVLLVCANTREDLERVSRCGANAWVTKPVLPGRLLESVGQLLAISARKGYRVLLKAKVYGATESISFFCTSRNVSVSGILIETETLLDRGARINCSFFLPGSRQIVADGEIVRSEKRAAGDHSYGVRFIDLSPENREQIEKFVASTLMG